MNTTAKARKTSLDLIVLENEIHARKEQLVES